MPTTGMNDHVTTPSIDSEPPLALDKFIEQSGLSGRDGLALSTRRLAKHLKHLRPALSDAL
jgi:hypothetical protein